MTLSWPSHLLTLEEWEGLPEVDGVRLELVEGILAVAPKPLPWHQKAATRLGYRVDEQLPAKTTTVVDAEVIIVREPLTIRAPDVIVVSTERYEENPPRFTAADVLLAVEILSDGTRRVDRVMKLSEYAEAGIPQYWIVDLDDPASLVAHSLVEGEYEVSGEHTGRAELTVAGHPVTVDLPALVRR
jgi:Uma2 family endonuclease